jgi:hypothetical protein
MTKELYLGIEVCDADGEVLVTVETAIEKLQVEEIVNIAVHLVKLRRMGVDFNHALDVLDKSLVAAKLTHVAD